MRKFLFVLAICLGFISLASAAEMNLALADGSAVTGEIMKFDDNGLMLRTVGDSYTNLPWARFSQEALKQLAANPKIKVMVEPFIEPEQAQHQSSQREIKITPVTRPELPANSSLIGGLFKSSVGLFILLVIYGANLYAAYEISVVKARPAGQVIGLSAILPIIGPIIFLALPMQSDAPPEEVFAEVAAPVAVGGSAAPTEAAVAEVSRKKEEKVPPQIFARGKFTFNKRFLETKFAGFVGEPGGDALKFNMTAKTGAGQFAVERIAQIGAAEIIFETPNGQVTVPFADIQEITLNPKTA